MGNTKGSTTTGSCDMLNTITRVRFQFRSRVLGGRGERALVGSFGVMQFVICVYFGMFKLLFVLTILGMLLLARARICFCWAVGSLGGVWGARGAWGIEKATTLEKQILVCHLL